MAKRVGVLVIWFQTSCIVGGFVMNDVKLSRAMLRRVGIVPKRVPSGEIAMNGPEAKGPRAAL